MTIRPDQHFRVEAGPALTAKQQVATDWATEAVRTRLPVLRVSAQQWQTTISTITGLFGAATVLTADKEVRALTWPFGSVYGVLVLMSLAFAALALWCASRAAEPDKLTISASVSEQVTLYDRVFQTASDRLWWSRFWTLPAVLLLILSLTVRWYAPQISESAADIPHAASQAIGNR